MPKRILYTSAPIALWIALLFIAALSNTAEAQSAAEWNSRGADAYEAGQWETAATAFRKAYKLDRNSTTIQQNLLNAAIMYSQYLNANGDLRGAVEWLEFVIKVDPENTQPLNQLGAFHLVSGEIASAIFRLEESIELDPHNVDAHFLLGESYYKDNDVTAAIDQWEWVYRVNPEYSGLQTRLSNALREEQVEFDFKGDSSRNFNVTYSREAENILVREILRILEQAYKDIGRKLGGNYPPTPIQVSLYTTEGFSESTQTGAHVGALFDGTKIRCPVLDKNGKSIPIDVLRERLYHEYVHVVVHHNTKNNVPWWFNEGLAETLSSPVSEYAKTLLKQAQENGALYELETISPQTLLRDMSPENLTLAYAQSHVTVMYLKNQYGDRRFSRMLDALRSGLTGEEALRDVFGLSYNALSIQMDRVIAQH